MSKNLNPIKRAVGYALICVVWAILLILLSFFAMVTAIYADLKAPNERFLTKGTALETVTRRLYLDYFRPIWQHQANCISFDEDLIYVPRVGVARFQGPEFDTNITIDPTGLRRQSPPADKQGLIAVAGDSHALGWGVNDEQTFSAVLARKYHLNTANAAAASYGTARELLRLRKLGLLARASTVVIQYCENDADENHDFVHDKAFIPKRDVRALWDSLQHFEQIEVTYPVVTKSSYQFIRDALNAGGMSALFKKLFFPTEGLTGQVIEATRKASVMADDFLNTLDAFPELKGKTVIVFEISGWGQKTDFIPEIQKLAAARANFIALEVPFVRSDFFRLDDHMNSTGHERVAAILFETIKRQH